MRHNLLTRKVRHELPDGIFEDGSHSGVDPDQMTTKHPVRGLLRQTFRIVINLWNISRMGVREFPTQRTTANVAQVAGGDWRTAIGNGSCHGISQGRFMHSFCCKLLVAGICAATSLVAQAQSLEELSKKVGVRVLAEASSDKQVLANTKQRLPFNRMSRGAQQRALDILRSLSQYRRMPSLQYPVDPNIYQYLINHPDVAVSTWRAMGISQLQMVQTAPFEFEASASDGSDGTADVLWRDGNQCLFIVEGNYNSPILPNPVQAKALVWLQYRFVKTTAGEYLVNQQVETFIHFPSAAIETIAKIATSLTNAILDRNVYEVSLYARMMSQAGQKDPEWMTQVAMRMDGVEPQRKTELVRVSRGLPPQGNRPTVLKGRQPVAVPLLQSANQFQSFENSLDALNVHVPLVPQSTLAGSEYSSKAAPLVYLPPGSAALPASGAAASKAEPMNVLFASPGSQVVESSDSLPVLPSKLHSPRSTISGLMDSRPESFVAADGKIQTDAQPYAKSPAGTTATPVPVNSTRGKSTVPAKTVSSSKVVEEKKHESSGDGPAPVPPALD